MADGLRQFYRQEGRMDFTPAHGRNRHELNVSSVKPNENLGDDAEKDHSRASN
jgi:hypothetical protein